MATTRATGGILRHSHGLCALDRVSMQSVDLELLYGARSIPAQGALMQLWHILLLFIAAGRRG
eukprot:11570777-Alexandrium_andersonii.AAC.1